MDFTNFWFPKKAGGDSGDMIGQSLRFRGAQTLIGSTSLTSTTFTWSGWVKLGSTLFSKDAYIFACTNDTRANQLIHSNNSTLTSNGGTPTARSTSFYRDPSAWHHFVFKCNAGTSTVFCNGEVVSGMESFASPALNAPMGIGCYGTSATSHPNLFEGYMADVYFIDGQALEPTAFGRYNEDDVWVPTIPNFAMGQSRYSDFLYTAPDSGQTYGTLGKNFHASFPASAAFDGELTQNAGTGMAGTASGGVWLVYKPPTPIEVTKVEVWTRNYQIGGSGGGKYSVNSGNSQPLPTFSADFEWFDIGLSGTLTSFGVQDNTNSVTYIGGIRITTTEGTEILLDPFLWSADLFVLDNDTYSEDPADLTQNFIGANTATNAFDGNVTTPTSAQGDTSVQNGWLVWLTSNDIENVTRLRIASTPTGAIRVNGNNITDTTPALPQGSVGSPNWIEINNPPATITSIGVSGNGSVPNIQGIEINGQILVDGVNNSYGPSGFHLDFSDPNDIGTDRSGNGNHFTPTGFVTAKAANYEFTSSSSTPNSFPSTSGGFNAPFELPSSYVYLGSTTGTFTWNFNSPIVANNSIGIYWQGTAAYGNNSLTITYADTTTTTHAFDDPGTDTQIPNLVSVNTSGGEIVKLELSNTGGSLGGFAGLEIDGSKLLLEGDGTDYDLMLDSPTQNYCTWQPLGFNNGTTNVTLLNANLTQNTTSTNAGSITFSKLPDSGKYVIQIQASSDTTINVRLHHPETQATNSATPREFYNITRGSDSSFLPRISTLLSTSDQQIAKGSNDPNCSILLDCDDRRIYMGDGAGNYLIQTPADGTGAFTVGAFAANTPTAQWAAGDDLLLTIGQGTNGLNINCGQRPFIFAVPEGFEHYQTQNLPEAPIANGRDHFQAITGPGQGDGQAFNEGNIGITDPVVLTTPIPTNQAQTTASNSLVVDLFGEVNTVDIQWNNTDATLNTILLSIDGTNWRNIGEETISGGATVTYSDGAVFRYVRQWRSTVKSNGIMSAAGVPILQSAQQTFPNGLWWIKDRVNNNNWQLACSQYDIDPTDNVVITSTNGYNPYTAPAGDSVAYCWDLTDPTVSGVEFISDTGTGVARTVNHNLGRVPQMVWAYNMVIPASNNVYVYHSAYGPNGAFNLANTNGVDARTAFWGGNPADFTTTTFGVGAAGSTNPVGAVYYWVFAEVPGFSAYGRYNGNATTDNSFVFTPFRPAFVMIKSIAAGGGWLIYDTTRNPNNPASLFMTGDSTLAETSGFDIDILSNGFKIRASNGPQAAATGTVWCAFAENPFSSPTTAR